MPQHFAPALFAFLLSGMMSFVVSGIATLQAMGAIEGFFRLWMSAWLPSWAVAFPTAFVVAPLVRRIVNRVTREV